MDKRSGEKSRREKRKEARSIKKVQKHQSWIQKSQKKKETIDPLKSKNVKKSKESFSQNSDSGSDGDYKSERPTVPNDIPRFHDSDSDINLDSEQSTISKKVPRLHNSAALKMESRNKSLKKKSKTKFEEYLEMSMPNAGMSAKEDMELERKLAKRLKIKGGQLRGMDDGMNMLFEGISSILEEDAIKDAEDFDPKSLEKHSSRKKRKKKMLSILEEDAIKDAEGFDPKSLEKPSSGKKRKKKMSSEQSPEDDEMAADTSVGLSEKAEISDAGTAAELPDKEPSGKKRKKRKVSVSGQEGSKAGDAPTSVPNAAENRVAEVAEESHIKTPSVKGNVKYIAPHLRSRVSNESEENAQIRRRIRGLLNRLSESNVESITGEISTIVRSVGRSAGSLIISEEVVKSCSEGPRGNEQYAAVFAAFVAGMSCLVGIDFGAKLLASVAKTFEDEYLKEDNLSLRNITLLLSYLCIFGVCSSDLIYDFLIMLSKRLLEIDVSTILTILQCCGMKIRSDDPASMKSFILSVQNRVNDLKASAGDGNENIIGKRMEFMLETICDIKNNKKRTKEDSVQQTRIKKWLQKLRVEDILIRGVTWNKLLDPNKKGQWWLSSDLASATDNVEELASTIDKEVLEAQKMLQLAAAQRMTTDARKAIFCIVMSGEDYIDAFEKLLRLDLHGKQDREIMRVLVDCCLQEKVFNKYYTALASKLCEHDKNHKFTLQFCLWDHFKELEAMNLQRSMHLAKFVAEMIASFTLSVAVLKAVDLSDCKQLTPKRMMHFRMLFEAILGFPDKLVWNIFTRAAVASDLEPLRNGIEFFIKEYVVRTNNAFSGKYKVAKKALNNMEGVLM